MLGRYRTLTAIATLLFLPVVATADTPTSFDLPAQSLAESLRSVGTQTSTNILFDTALVTKIEAPAIKESLTLEEALTRLLLMFSSAWITQMVQTAACNRHHPIDQQLCRWMLLSLDRLPANRISMTEKLIGNMLGLSPGDVTKATDQLQQAGLIHYDAGEITVLDRAGVEERSCECHDVVKKESDRLLRVAVPLASDPQGETIAPARAVR